MLNETLLLLASHLAWLLLACSFYILIELHSFVFLTFWFSLTRAQKLLSFQPISFIMLEAYEFKSHGEYFVSSRLRNPFSFLQLICSPSPLVFVQAHVSFWHAWLEDFIFADQRAPS